MALTLKDARGVALTGGSAAALESYELALGALRTYRGDPVALLDQAIAAAPGFAAAHVAKALVLMTFFERRFASLALEALDAGQAAITGGNARERALGAAARQLAEGDWHGGVRALDRVLVENPRDILALQVAHLVDFNRGDALNLRNRVARVLPRWSATLPGYSYVLGMHSFGLEECNQYAEAEKAGLRALELDPADCWAIHSVVHVLEMQGRIEEGVRFLQGREADWAGADNGFAFHNWWHLALFHLDNAGYDAALRIYDEVLAQAHGMAMSRLDATSLLWRLQLEGVDVKERIAAVADAWQADLEAEAGFYAFNDFHAAMAFAGARREKALGRLRARMDSAAWEEGANAEMTRLVGCEAVDGVAAFGRRGFGEAVDKLLAVRDGASRFGGSHAQRDVITLTLVEAARAAGNVRLAAHIANERLMQKPGGLWGRRIAARLALHGASANDSQFLAA
jgi:tetratricopeptide (TPR) repeat protein